MRSRLAAIDLGVLVAALLLSYALRAAVAHPELLTVRSLGTFVGVTLVYAAPMVALAFAAAGLYSSAWDQVTPAAVAAAAGWASVATLFAVILIGPDDAPLATVLPAFVVLAGAFVGARQLAARHFSASSARRC